MTTPMTDRELMRQALEALTAYDGTNGASQRKRVLAALRERLAQPEQEPFCYHDGRNIVGKEYADHSDVFPLYTSPNPEQQKPVRFNCTVIDDANLNGVPLSQWGKQHEMQPCAGRNCGSTNPNLHSAECFEDYEKSTGMNDFKPDWDTVKAFDDRYNDDTELLRQSLDALEYEAQRGNDDAYRDLRDALKERLK